jgi:hypothetical protein
MVNRFQPVNADGSSDGFPVVNAPRPAGAPFDAFLTRLSPIPEPQP